MSLDARWAALVKSGRAGWRAGMAAAVGPRLIGRVSETTADGTWEDIDAHGHDSDEPQFS